MQATATDALSQEMLSTDKLGSESDMLFMIDILIDVNVQFIYSDQRLNRY